MYNGYWLFRMLSSRPDEPFLYTAWWLIATVLSCAAFVCEKKLDPAYE